MANWGESILGGVLGGLGGGMGAYAQNQEDQRKFLMDQWYRQQEVKNAADRLALDREKMNAEQRLNYASPEEAQQMMALFHILNGPEQASAIVSGGNPTAAVSTGSPSAAATSAGAGVQGVPASGGGGGGSLQAASAFPQMPGGLVPRTLLNTLITQGAAAQAAMRAEQFKVAQEQAARERLAGSYTNLANASPLPAVPPELTGKLAEGEDPEAAAMIPRTAGTPAMPDPNELLAASLARGGVPASEITKIQEMRRGQAMLDRILSGQPIGGVAPAGGAAGAGGGAISGPPGYGRPEIGIKVGDTNISFKPQGVTNEYQAAADMASGGRTQNMAELTQPERAIAEPLVREMLARNPDLVVASYLQSGDPTKTALAKQYIDVQAQREASNAAAIEKSRLPQTPLSDADKAALDAHGKILAGIQQIKTFSPQEIANYIGIINKPFAEGRQILAGAGLVNEDRRYADFQNAVGRMKGTAFGEGGKQLTPFESSVVMAYTPNGDERTAAQLITKVKTLEAITRTARDIRLEMAKTGRGAIDPEAYDNELRGRLNALGISAPVEAPGWSTTAPSQGREPIYVRNQQTKERGKWEGTMPPPSGFQEIPPWEVTEQGLSTPSRTPGPPGTQMPAARSQAPQPKFIYDPNSNQLFPK